MLPRSGAGATIAATGPGRTGRFRHTGDPGAADDTLIPPAVGLDHPDYILGHGQLDYAAEARLINDNLLDCSHLTFVHAASFGAGPEFAANPGRITPLERGIRYERWIENSTGSSSRRSGPSAGCQIAFAAHVADGTLHFFHERTGALARPLTATDFADPAACAARVLKEIELHA